ncbi:hypothetical protein A2U01_0104652, partial [Trifolium medium]|nr:hypothetical protein [Trifolium medium]
RQSICYESASAIHAGHVVGSSSPQHPTTDL